MDQLFFEAGAEGGGERLYLRPDGSYYVKGSSGGFLDEDEFPRTSWTRDYPDFEAFFAEFVHKNGSFWVRLFPVFLHPDSFPVIREALAKAADESNPDCAMQWHNAMAAGGTLF